MAVNADQASTNGWHLDNLVPMDLPRSQRRLAVRAGLPSGRCCVAAAQGMLVVATWTLDQIAMASSANATATRRFAGSSAASSSCSRRTFCTNACPAMITLVLRSCLRPRIGRSRAFSRP